MGKNVEKVARICWNKYDWKRPSGTEGKSRGVDAFENLYGFGHEEWLLDDSKTIDGYHYAFLEPVNTKMLRHAGQTYDIHLFTFNPLKKKEYVGVLRNVECLSEKQSKAAYSYYRKAGWLQEMKEDVHFAVNGGKVKNMDWTMFNIRFKFADAEIYYSNRPIISGDDPNTRGLYYKLMDMKGPFIFEKDEEGAVKTINTNPWEVVTREGRVLVDPLHKKIQARLIELLKDQYVHLYPESSIASESDRIDLKGQPLDDQEHWHYFEIKTSSAKRSIREALGQILEYAHYPKTSRAVKLFIVGPEKPDDKDAQYMEYIRKTYKMPVWFRWYSFEENKLYEGI